MALWFLGIFGTWMYDESSIVGDVFTSKYLTMDLVQWQLTTQRSWITPYLHFVLLSRWCEHQPHVTKLHPIRQMEQSPLLNIKFQGGLLPERDVPVCRELCWAGKAGRATPDVAVSDSCHRECWCLPRSSRREDIHCCATSSWKCQRVENLGGAPALKWWPASRQPSVAWVYSCCDGSGPLASYWPLGACCHCSPHIWNHDDPEAFVGCQMARLRKRHLPSCPLLTACPPS